MLDVDVVAVVVQLTNADEVGVEARDVADIRQLPVFASLASEQNHPAPFNVDDRAIVRSSIFTLIELKG